MLEFASIRQAQEMPQTLAQAVAMGQADRLPISDFPIDTRESSRE